MIASEKSEPHPLPDQSRAVCGDSVVRLLASCGISATHADSSSATRKAAQAHRQALARPRQGTPVRCFFPRSQNFRNRDAHVNSPWSERT
jgi:hypothetical protein